MEPSFIRILQQKLRKGIGVKPQRKSHQTLIEAERSSKYIFCLVYEYFSKLSIIKIEEIFYLENKKAKKIHKKTIFFFNLVQKFYFRKKKEYFLIQKILQKLFLRYFLI